MLKNKKILITGATGFIGANLVHHFLRESANITILTRKTSNKWRIKDVLNDISEYCVDLLDESELQKAILNMKPEIIFHSATYGGYIFQQDLSKIIQTNILGTINLINACSKVGFEVFINIGSSSEYGIKDKPMSETDILNPVTDYAVAKCASTLFCQSMYLRFGLPIVTLRVFSVYGYYEEPTRLIPSVIVSCLKNKNPKVASPEPVRDFIFIEDVIEAFVKVIENIGRVKGEIFNIGSGQQQCVGKVVSEIIKLTGNKVKPEWGVIPNPRLEPKMWQADISKAKKILNWQPKYDLNEGLKKTIDWFKNNIWLYE